MEKTNLQTLERRIKILEEAVFITTAPKENLILFYQDSLKITANDVHVDRLIANLVTRRFNVLADQIDFFRAGSFACVVDTCIDQNVDDEVAILKFILQSFGMYLASNANCFVILINTNPNLKTYNIRELGKHYKKIQFFDYDFYNGAFIDKAPAPSGSELIVEKTRVEPPKKVLVLEPKKESSKGKEEESVIEMEPIVSIGGKKPIVNVYIKFPFSEDQDAFQEIMDEQIKTRGFTVVDTTKKLTGEKDFTALCFSIKSEKDFWIKRGKIDEQIGKPKLNGYRFAQIILPVDTILWPDYESKLYDGYIYDVTSEIWEAKLTGEFLPEKKIKFI